MDKASEIAHLTDEDIEELYLRYLSGEKNKVLIEQYNISINPNKLISIIPPVEHKNSLCPYCNKTMYSKRRSKTASSLDTPPVECFSCQHKQYEPNKYGVLRQCFCTRCLEDQKKIKLLKEQNIQDIIFTEYNIEDSQPTPYESLSFSHKLYLVTLFKIQTDESFEFIQAIDDSQRNIQLTPTHEMDTEVIKDLYKQNIILVDPNSNINAFDAEENYKSFHIDRVQWVLNITFDGNHRSSLSDAFNIIYNDFLTKIEPSSQDEIHTFLYRLAREEIMQYVFVKSEELNVYFSAANKTREIITQLLNDFSVSEIYYFVKKAVENAHIYYSKGFSNGKKHAANTIPKKMLELGERALIENWKTYTWLYTNLLFHSR